MIRVWPLSILVQVLAAATVFAAQARTFIDYFLPTPSQGALSGDAWGAPNVLPRDPNNGLEDKTIMQYGYWDGQIVKAADGKYHMFASRWSESRGHGGWFGSVAVHAVSDSLMGPYVDKGLCWPNDTGGRGHNVTALTLPDGRYYHILVNSWSTRMSYHLTSVDGIKDWTHRGVAYDPRTSMVRYPDGTVNHWNKLERPGIYVENGHVAAVTLAAIDVEKEQDQGGDGHGSKVIVVPFDGAALDRDLQVSADATKKG